MMEIPTSFSGVSSYLQKNLEAAKGLTTVRPTWLTTIFAGIFVVLVVHRIFHRRLKLPPGPRNFPIIGAIPSLGSELHKKLTEHAKIYGPLIYFRLGSLPMMVIQSPELAEELFRHKDVEFASRAHSTILYSAAKYFGFGAANMGFAPYTPTLRQIRKVCTKELLTSTKLSHTDHVRWEEQGEMIREIEQLKGKEFEMKELIHTMTMNVTCRMLFGKRYYGKKVAVTGELREFQELMIDMVTTAGKPNVSDIMPFLRWLDPQGLTKKFKELHKKQERVMREILEDHKMAREGSAHRLSSPKTMDFVDVLLSLPAGEDKLSDTSIMATVSDMLLGATDSTMTIVQWAVIELMRSPERMAKLQKELDEVVGKARGLLEADLPKLRYLEAVVKEILRLYPTVPLLIPRMNEKQTSLHGYDIPKNTSLFVNIWAIGRHPNYWEKPDQFIPERFLGSSTGVVGNHFHYTPFGAGRRQCIGVNMGMLMVERTLGILVHAFDWLPPNGLTAADISNEDMYGMVLEPKHALVCRALPRLPNLDFYYYRRYMPPL